ncbi:helix-turn-helix domain-containing protein [Streptomyces sp. BE133]|uniref:helix-turn-helix domain-containing protein n=1 Tax=Streptomyces sp. BE133 TaxID=3002523 RepID=UPI002E76B23D|nr:helix-turn-helix transcriptional regulator [Streptomyces sp. BE133]MEE1807267.1 helix-turn-helix transcriptional regulator [Streptomyces sp. BE133]
MTTVALDTGVGPLLRSWREQRRISQLELALRADSSARHISFIETGRSRPSEDMILRLAEHLDIPVRERNALLVVAGYAPRYAQTALDDPALGALREGMERLLQGYDPYPALVVDGMYNVVAANRGIAMLLEGVAGHLLAPPLNAMRLTLHPEGLAPRIRNLREWRADLLAQMDRQIALARSAELRELYEEVAGYPAPEGADRAEGAGAAGSGGGAGSPVGENAGAGPASSLPFALPLHIEHGGQVLSFVSSIATFNTPMDVTVAELAIETFLPADRATADHLRSLTS